MATVAYPENNGVKIIVSANTPDYTDIPGVLINPNISGEAMSSPESHREIVDGAVVKKSEADIAALDTRTNKEKREAEYEERCDPYLPVLNSYNLTNDERFQAVYDEWKAIRDSIAAEYPDEV